jgi:SWI/SNF-related matrix-associated actin-dependent regulator 1 of chromatin subfamily A
MPLFQTRGDDVANDGGVKLLEQITKSSRNGKKKLNGFITEEDRVYGDLKQLLAPFILRRRKVDVIRQALPPKIHKVEMVPFDESTRNLYDSILRSHISAGNTVKEVESITADASKCKNIFTLLRKAANHPLLLRTRHTSPEAIEELSHHLFNLGYFGSDKSCTIQLVRSELEGFSDFDIHLATLDILDECPFMRDSLSKYTLTEEDLFCSPKFKRLKVLLPNLLEQDHRYVLCTNI